MIHLINGIAEPWFRYMASATVQATLLALFVLGLLQIGRRWRPALRYALMMLALCKFVIPPMLSLPTGLFSRIQPQQLAESAPPLHYVAPVARKIFRPVVNVPSETGLSLPPSSLSTPILTTDGKLLLLHLLGALLIVTLAVVQQTRLRRLAYRSSEVQDLALAEAYNALSRSMRLSRKPRLLISKDNHAPIAFGLWKPAIMLPETLVSSLPLSEILVVLGHELAHHRRRDLWISWLQVIVSAVWWFNPAYWLLSRSIRSVREDCCDDMVLASGLASGEDYCRTLLKAARTALDRRITIHADSACLCESQPLRRRFKRIMRARFIRTPKLALTGMIFIIALALVLLPGVNPISGHPIPDAAHDDGPTVYDMMFDSSPADIGEKIKVIENNKIREGDALFIEGKRIIDNYLSSRGKSIDRNSTEFQKFLSLTWTNENYELNSSGKHESVDHYLITVLGLKPDTETPMVDENDPALYSAFNRPIHDAAKAGDLAKVKALLKEDPHLVFSKDNDGSTPLHGAVSNGHKGVVDLLIAKGAGVNTKDNYGETPLRIAAIHGRKDIMELLIAKGAKVNAVNGHIAPLHDAASFGHKDVVELLIAKGAYVNAKDYNGETPLHSATQNGHMDIMELLLANKAEVNAKDNDNRTPLHDAARYGYADEVELLLTKGAKVNARDGWGQMPLHVAAAHGHKEVAKLMLTNRAEVNAKDNDSRTPLLSALHFERPTLSYGYSEIVEKTHKYMQDMVEILLANKADVNAKDNKGVTALHAAAAEGLKAVAEWLLAKGAEVNTKDDKGETPLHRAVASGNKDVIELLRRHGGHE
jgi:ankyrin repeat protein/beta-lactamase regulating signal transducer with metallopeptidase domain